MDKDSNAPKYAAAIGIGTLDEVKDRIYTQLS